MDIDSWHMSRALELAALGRGAVEPNPLVGCVIAQGAEVIGDGWHRRFGGPHAEVEALVVAGPRAAGATLYVTLEPCCHWGKTPPCTSAILAAGVRRVVVALRDPFPAVDGGGLAALQSAGVNVEAGLCESDARRLNAPYLKLLATGRPWVLAKWAMTLDGKLATYARKSRWISGVASRQLAHRLRGRVDAIVVGRGTVEADDPLLTARPRGPRLATRIVLDASASLSEGSQLVRTAREAPVLVAAAPSADVDNRRRLESAGCEVLICPSANRAERWLHLLEELGRRRTTNVLVEGGSQVLGSLLDEGQFDEAHVFVAPTMIGGESAPSPVGGQGLADMRQAWRLESPRWQMVEDDWYVHGTVVRPAPDSAGRPS